MVAPVRPDGRELAAPVTSVAVLGPLEVRRGSAEVAISGSLLRLLLLRLAVDAPRPVSAAALIDAVWAGDPPEEPVNALQSLVSRLRRSLGGAAAVTGEPLGYRLSLPDRAVDADRFARLAAQGRRELHDGEPEHAAATLARALDLWRGEALADAGDAGWALPTRRSLETRRVEALLDRLADVALGRQAALAGELATLDLQYPLDERFAARLVDALAADGRTAAALGAYEQFRARLADALGTDPSPALRARHLSLLRGAPGDDIGAVPAAGAAHPEARAPDRGVLPLPLTTFVGRESDVAGLRTLLADSRLVTIVGTGGCGKTRLATEVAATHPSATHPSGSHPSARTPPARTPPARTPPARVRRPPRRSAWSSWHR